MIGKKENRGGGIAAVKGTLPVCENVGSWLAAMTTTNHKSQIIIPPP
jgi:hypothetical protein